MACRACWRGWRRPGWSSGGIAPADGRGLLVVATEAGREMRRRMWAVYGPALHEVVGRRLSSDEFEGLAALLGRLIVPPEDAQARP